MLEQLSKVFSDQFLARPEFAIRSPGRVNLIGEHIDYLGGKVMPVAINRSIRAVGRVNQSNKIRIWTSITNAIHVLSNQESTTLNGEDYWLNYLVGVLDGFRKKGIICPGLDLVIDTDLSIGAGLSASAALETLLALAIEKSAGIELDAIERATLCQKAEHDFAGVPCGLMDQLAVGCCESGHALMIDCQSLELNSIPIPSNLSIVVSDTKVSHSLGDGQYQKRVEECQQALHLLKAKTWREVTVERLAGQKVLLGKPLYQRARHVITEMQRVEQFAEALRSEDCSSLANLMRNSHRSLRDDYQVSCAELDFLVASAYEFGSNNGVIGSRMTGGGFGGSTVSLVETEAAQGLVDYLENRFEDQYGSSIEPFVTKSVAGAVCEDLV